MARFFEVDRRRRDFVDGHHLRLSDGDQWSFPYPRERYRLPLDPAGKPEIVVSARDTATDFSAAFWDKRAALMRAMAGPETDTLIGAASAILPVAYDLLARNYDLAPDEARELLDLRPLDPTNLAMWRDLLTIIVEGEAGFIVPSPSAPADADTADENGGGS